MFGKTGKLYFNENEAARILGVSVERFRMLLQQHILDRADDVANSSQTTFQASDIVLMKMFVKQGLQQPASTALAAQP